MTTVYGNDFFGPAVLGVSVQGTGVRGTSDAGVGTGVEGINYNKSGAGVGIHGESRSSTGTGIEGECDDGTGVHGKANSILSLGVEGENVDGTGVWGHSRNSTGVLGTSRFSTGVFGFSGASAGFAGFFNGNVSVNGTLTKSLLNFKIDHPLDPANKYLLHSGVESPDMKNLYDGVAVLDAQGEAIVELPLWFEALNQDFRYQLTPIGAPGPNLYIAEEISDRRFKIAGGTPDMKVCWQVTGNRKDAYAQAHPLVVEQEKPAPERGHYLHPEVYGHSQEQSIAWVHSPEALRRSMEEQ